MTARAAGRILHPKTTVRWRLTLLYGGLFLVSGAALLAVTYGLADKTTITRDTPVEAIVHAVSGKGSPTPRNANAASTPTVPTGNVTITGGGLPTASAKPAGTALATGSGGGQRAPSATRSANQVAIGGASAPGLLRELRATAPGLLRNLRAAGYLTPNVNATFPPGPGGRQALKEFFSNGPGRRAITFVGTQQRVSDLHQLIVESSIALAVMALISAALGWLVAGRVLRPLRTMTSTTQQISEISLDRRLAMEGPRDELRQLADTIDGLLERLEAAFDAQRRFVANASHELRTPLTAARAMLEMIISDPNATIETFRETCVHVLDESERQEQLIDALLALAQGQRGIDHREAMDLSAIAGEVVSRQGPEAALRGLTLDASLEPALVSGDPRLIERLVSNLVENAIRHNVPAGRVDIRVAPAAGRAILEVVNTGPEVPEDQVDRLLQPFQRLTPERLGHGDGLGLGLSIVAAIANAHNAELDARPAPGGGLDIAVRFRRPLDIDLVPTLPEAPRQAAIAAAS